MQYCNIFKRHTDYSIMFIYILIFYLFIFTAILIQRRFFYLQTKAFVSFAVPEMDIYNINI